MNQCSSTGSAPGSGLGRGLSGWYFKLFFLSGFCSLLYELIWLRLAMAQFGVTTALVSIVLSVFMAGLGFGSWASGALLRRYESGIRFPVLRLYAITEILIGVSAFAVPHEFLWGRQVLEQATLSSSYAYYFGSGIWLALTIVPWCALMGTTIPLGMLAIRQTSSQTDRRSFSFLYLANVGGAVVGAASSMALIELFGFHQTLKIGAALNTFIGIAAVLLSSVRSSGAQASRVEPRALAATDVPAQGNVVLALLFLTGLTGMGMEVMWLRELTPYLGTQVYAFAVILTIYLGASFFGSRVYRIWSTRREQEPGLVWMLLATFALLSAVAGNPGVPLTSMMRVLIAVMPFTALLGFVSPMLVDRWSGGNASRAGTAYAVNIIGCILGPLVASFALLPYMSGRWGILALTAPWLVLGTWPKLSSKSKGGLPSLKTQLVSYALLPVAVALFAAGKSYEDSLPARQVLRDSTATVVAQGSGFGKQLLVNGVGMTYLTPVAKTMAHLPLAFLDHPPKNALVICFGMGTTFRSLMSWDIPVTAVELVPSVPRMFWYYHSDAAEILRSPQAHIVIDDGRRFLERTTQRYDVITVDPPPPVEAAGSSLLYSKEFYSVVKRRLQPAGILQQWLPLADRVTVASVARALQESFAHVRVFHSIEGYGYHFIASDAPIPQRTAAEMAERMPPRAATDLMEWIAKPTLAGEFDAVLRTEVPIESLFELAPAAPALTDDRAVNEYYLLRRYVFAAR